MPPFFPAELDILPDVRLHVAKKDRLALRAFRVDDFLKDIHE